MFNNTRLADAFNDIFVKQKFVPLTNPDAWSDESGYAIDVHDSDMRLFFADDIGLNQFLRDYNPEAYSVYTWATDKKRPEHLMTIS